jgi:signal peptide peptidase SppA
MLKNNNDTNNHFSADGALVMNPPEQKIHWLSFLPFERFSSNAVVSVLRLSGVIGKVGMRGGLTLESLNESIEKAFKTSKLSALCLVINSPGGSPVQSELIASRIMSLAKEKDVPVYSFVEDVAASGGYWLACAADEIYASKSSIVGSIGVISSGFGFQSAIEKLGIERRVYTEGKSKSVLDPFQEAKASDIKLLRGLQQEVHEHFINHVKARRKGKLTQDDDILFNGEFWAGKNAVDFGLIDGIDDMYSFIKRKFGDKAKIEYMTPKQSWFKKKLGIEGQAQEILSAIVTNLRQEVALQRFDLG